jgi:hypothetical protein
MYELNWSRHFRFRQAHERPHLKHHRRRWNRYGIRMTFAINVQPAKDPTVLR